MNKKIINILLLFAMFSGLHSCKEKDEPSEVNKAMTTIHGRFIEFGTNKGIEGLPVSLIEYMGLGFSYRQLTDVIYTDSAGNFTITHELEKDGIYQIYSYDLSFTYSDPGNGYFPSFDNLQPGKTINVVYQKYAPAWVNVRVINHTRPIYSSYTVSCEGPYASLLESLKCYDTTFNFQTVGNKSFDLKLNVYLLKNNNTEIVLEKSFPFKVQNWKTNDTTITF